MRCKRASNDKNIYINALYSPNNTLFCCCEVLCFAGQNPSIISQVTGTTPFNAIFHGRIHQSTALIIPARKAAGMIIVNLWRIEIIEL